MGHKGSWSVRHGNQSRDAPSYTKASVVDYLVCRRADRFVGWHGSSFARMLARYQALRFSRGAYQACPEGVSRVEANQSWLAIRCPHCVPVPAGGQPDPRSVKLGLRYGPRICDASQTMH